MSLRPYYLVGRKQLTATSALVKKRIEAWAEAWFGDAESIEIEALTLQDRRDTPRRGCVWSRSGENQMPVVVDIDEPAGITRCLLETGGPTAEIGNEVMNRWASAVGRAALEDLVVLVMGHSLDQPYPSELGKWASDPVKGHDRKIAASESLWATSSIWMGELSFKVWWPADLVWQLHESNSSSSAPRALATVDPFPWGQGQVTLTLALAESKVDFTQLSGLSIGDVLVLDHPIGRPLNVKIDDQRLKRSALLGRRQGRRAFCPTSVTV